MSFRGPKGLRDRYGEGQRAELSPAALRMLPLPADADVEVRAVHSGALGA
jgi:hypothetical protein